MAHEWNKLNAKEVKDALEAGTPAVLYDGGGLSLRVASSSKASWVYRWFDGKAHETGLGKARATPLALARKKAQALREKRSEGIDLVAEKEAARAAQTKAKLATITFAKAARSLWEGKREAWKSEDHRQAWLQSLELHVFPVIGSKPIGEIDTDDVLRVVKPHWSSKYQTMFRVRQRIEAVLSYATATGLRQGENPARWAGHMEHMGLGAPVKVKHHEALKFADLPPFLARLRGVEGAQARAFELMILTAMRTAETIGLRWDEVDLDAKMIVIPAARMKMSRDHRIPLSARAVEILRAQGAQGTTGELVFPGEGIGGLMGKATFIRLLAALDGNGCTPHGFRSTFKDWAVECTDYPNDMSEIALAHDVGTSTETAYRRGAMVEKRRAMMQDWADALTGNGG